MQNVSRLKSKKLIFSKEKDLYAFVAGKWAEISRRAIKQNNNFTVALSAGKTPVKLYRFLASQKNSLPWDKTEIFLVDERFVSSGHPDSNYRMIKNNLQKNIHPVRISRTPAYSARQYEKELKYSFGLRSRGLPRFDLILLGIGEDGHTASLFADDAAILEKSRLAVGVSIDRIQYSRVSLTLPVINNARNVIFLVMGKNKAGVIKEIFRKTKNSLPSSLVRPLKGRIYFLLDREAGRKKE